MQLNGGQALIKALEMEGVEVIFGLPGGAILPVYDPIIDSPIRHILVRHEQGAGHMAEGYAHATGKPGVAMVTSGPGATNIVTPLADAFMDSVPMVCITGQVPTSAIGTDAFQEADITGITQSVTKHNFLVTDAQDIPRTIREAFHIATTGRPGPVLVDIPKDIVDPTNPRSAMEWYWPTDAEVAAGLPGYKPTTAGHPKKIKEAAELILAAERPVIYAGGGILKARAAEALRELAELLELPVVTTLMARGAFPDDHPLCLGMPGMHGNYTAIMSMQESDLLIALGSRFDDRVTGKVGSFAPGAKVIHADIDPAELGKVRRPDVPIVGDCNKVIVELVSAVRSLLDGGAAKPDLSEWRSTLSGWQELYPLAYEPHEEGEALKPQAVLEALRDSAPEDCIVASGVGQHQMWTSQYWKFRHPYTWINSGGLGTMGFSVPAAMGAKVGEPDRTVWSIDGDGCFQMTNQELVTCAINEIPIKVAIINNSSLGMVRQWQTLFYESRYSNTDLHTGHGTRRIPDFVKLSEAMGCVGLRCETDADVDATIKRAMEIDDQPVVVDFTVSRDAMVWPMVAAGTSNDEIQYARGIAPEWDRGEEEA